MLVPNHYHCHLADETQQKALATNIAQQLKRQPEEHGFIIYLQGDLGTGKTTFARAFIHASGFDGIVKSPTYTLVEPYPISLQRTCYHFDLYRLAEPEELEFIGVRDYFNQNSVCLIEWPDKARGFLPQADWICHFFHQEIGRKCEISALTEKGKTLMLQAFPDD